MHLGGKSVATGAEDYFKIVCSVPAWTRGAARTSIQLVDATSNISVPEAQHFEYGQQILRIEPSECLAIGGNTNLTIIGGGFSPFSNYSVLLQRIVEGPEESFVTEQIYCPLAEFRSMLLMVFSMPSWPYSAGPVKVILVMDDIVDMHAGTLNLTIMESLSSYEPHCGLVYGNIVLLQGFGFIQEPIYRCRLHNLANTSQFILSEPVTPYSVTMVECNLDFWPYEAQDVGISLFREGLNVTRTGDTGLYSMIAAWRGSSMSYQLSFSGGQQVTIVGGGFTTSEEATYQCRWYVAKDADTQDEVLLASAAIAQAPDSITCSTPFFFSHRDLGCASFSLWHAADASPAPQACGALVEIDAQGFAWKRVQQAYVAQGSSCIDFGGNPSMSDGTLNGPVRGNSLITLWGRNFGFQDVSPEVRVGDTTCEFTQWLAESQLVCSVPAKGAEAISNDLIFTVGNFYLVSISAAFSYDGGAISHVYRTVNTSDGLVQYSNSITKGSAHVTMLGIDFSAFDSSIAARIRGTACETTQWISGTALTCQHRF